MNAPATGYSPLRPDPAVLGADWKALVEAEAAQVERLREFADSDYYAPIARHFSDDPRREGDDILDALRALSGPDASWLDIGAGGGRYALPLALASRRVTAIEPSAGMRAVLQESAAQYGIDNVEVAPLRWPEGSETLRADLSLASHVGYDIVEINAFIDAMERVTRERCVSILMDRAPSSGFTRLWQQVHGEPRQQLPAMREFLHLLLARGATPDVRIFRREPSALSRDDLPENARRRLWLRAGSDKDRRLQELLAAELAAGTRDFEFPSIIALITWAPPVKAR